MVVSNWTQPAHIPYAEGEKGVFDLTINRDDMINFEWGVAIFDGRAAALAKKKYTHFHTTRRPSY